MALGPGKRTHFLRPLESVGSAHAGAQTRGRGGSPSHPPRRTNHAAFFSLLMGSLRKNGWLGDPALPSLSNAG